jgi:hypothetical protein
MNKENVIYMHSRLLVCHRKEQNYVICRKTDETADVMLCDISQFSKDKYWIFFPHIWNLKLKKKVMKVEWGLFGKRKETKGRRAKEGYGGVKMIKGHCMHVCHTIYTCMS